MPSACPRRSAHIASSASLALVVAVMLVVTLGVLLINSEPANADSACGVPPGGLETALGDGGEGVFVTWRASSCAPGTDAVDRRRIAQAGGTRSTFGENQATTLYLDENHLGLFGDPVIVVDPDPRADQHLFISDGSMTARGSFAVGRDGQVSLWVGRDRETASGRSLTSVQGIGDAPRDAADEDVRDSTVPVVAVDRPGTVEITGDVTRGEQLTASLTADPDGAPTNVTWQWSRALHLLDAFTDIGGATSASYTPTTADTGHYLRATASYDDPHGPGKSASAATSEAFGATNAAPTFSRDAVLLLVPENVTEPTDLRLKNQGHSFTAVDSDGDTLTYSISDYEPGSGDAGSFTVDAATGQLTTRQGATFDFETRPRYKVTLSVHDGKDTLGGSDTRIDDTIRVNIGVENEDEPGSAQIHARDPNGWPVAFSYSATDPDGISRIKEPYWYRGDSVDGDFERILHPGGRPVVTSTYQTTGADAGKYIRVRVRYTDAGPTPNRIKWAEATWPDPVGVDNTSPSFGSAGPVEFRVREDSPPGTLIGEVEYSDPDSSSVTCAASGSDASSFVVDNDCGISTKTGVTLNFEGTKTTYTLMLSLSDGEDPAGLPDAAVDDTIDVTIIVADANDAPTVSGGPTTPSVTENSTTVAGYTASDEDASDTQSWSAGGDDGSLFEVDASGRLSFKSAPDYEAPGDLDGDNVYDVAVIVTDAGGLSGQRDVAVTVTPTASDPEIAELTLTDAGGRSVALTPPFDPQVYHYEASVPSRTAAVTVAATTSASGATLEFVGRVDAIENGDTSEIDYSLAAGENHVTIDVTSPDGNQTNRYTITITRPTARPSFGSAGPVEFRVREDSPPGTLIGEVEYSDPDSSSVTCAASGSDASSFVVDNDCGISTKTGVTLNFEGTKTTYTLMLSLSDGEDPAGLPDAAVDDTIDVTIIVADANDAPTVSGGPTTPSVTENSTTVAGYTASDEDASDTQSWSAGGDDGSLFEVDASGRLSFKSAPDYEAPGDLDGDNVYDVAVIVTDAGGLSGQRDVAVTVTPTASDPEIAELTLTDAGGRSVALTPPFDPQVYHYEASVPSRTAAVTVAATTSASGATLEFVGRVDAIENGDTSEIDYSLAAGENHVTIDVTSPDGNQTNRYTITITRVTAGSEGYCDFADRDPLEDHDHLEEHDGLLLPDLVSCQHEYSIAEVVVAPDGTEFFALRFTGFVTNLGDGPVDLKGNPQLADTADLTSHDVWQRALTVEGDWVELTKPPIKYETTDGHGHFHLMGIVEYSLWDESGTVETGTGPKVGFCLVDITKRPDMHLRPGPGRYDDIDPEIRYCQHGRPDSESLRMGLSEGWQDIYSYSTPLQWIDLSDVQPGHYRLGQRVDPDNVIVESDETNNGLALSHRLHVVPGYIARPQTVRVESDAAVRFELSADEYSDDTHQQDGSTRAHRIATQPVHGSLDVGDTVAVVVDGATHQVFTDRWITYIPDPGYAGTDSFTFVALDLSRPQYPINPAVAKVTLDVSAPETTIASAPDKPEGAAVFIGGVDLEWRHVPGAERYEVQQYRDRRWNALPGDGVEIAFYGAGAIISGLDPQATLWFRVRAADTHGVSEWSEMLHMNSTHQYRPGRRARPANTPASGAPVIRGEAQPGETLWADTTPVEDGNGLERVWFRYQWLADDGNTVTEIADATAATYTLADDDGKTVKVRVTFTDRDGYAESLTSAGAGTSAAAPNSPATGAPTISGTPQVGETLTADTSAITDDDGHDGVSFTYQWLADDGNTVTEIADATAATYTLADDDEAKTVKVRVTFTDNAGHDETLTSTGLTVLAAPNSPATGAPTISGTPQVGETLTADTSAITDDDGHDGVSFTYQWLADDGNTVTEIADATAATYTLADDDEAKTVKVRVTFTDNAGHDETLTSTGLTVLAAPNSPATGAPTISGTPQVGETLTADTSAITDDDGHDGVSFTYQWLADDGNTVTEIADATAATYTLADDDEAKTVKVRVTFTDNAGHDETLTSTGLTVLAAPNSPATGAPTISGTPQVGETLTADTSAITDDDGHDGVSFTYQWLADDGNTVTEIADATAATYTLADDDEAKTVKVRVTFTDNAGHDETLISAASAAVAAGPPSDPPGTPRNLIGTVNADGSVTLNWEAPRGEPATSYQILRKRPDQGERQFQVLVDDTASSATEFVDTEVTLGEPHIYRVIAINTAGLSKRSDFVRVTPVRTVGPDPNSPATGAPAITGTPRVGETLSADTSAIEDADGLSNAVYRYQWIVSDFGADLEIPGATGSTYTVIAIDRGLVIKLRVSVTDDRGHRETLTSAATAVIR